MEHSVDENIELLCRKYLDVAAAAAASCTAEKDGTGKEVVNMAKLTEWFCYDSVAQIARGKTYGTLLPMIVLSQI